MADSAQPFAAKKFLEIKGRRMAYIDEGLRRSHRFRAWSGLPANGIRLGIRFLNSPRCGPMSSWPRKS
jgi:hypothetical protein